MKQYFLLVSAIVLATLMSCTKESELDSAIVSALNSQVPISFTTYASSATETKGTPINSNSDFQDVGLFDVRAQIGATVITDFTYTFYSSNDEEDSALIDAGIVQDNQIKSYTAVAPASDTAVNYFNFSSVEYDEDSGSWENLNSMYWPNYSKVLYFAAVSPSSSVITFEDSEDYGFNCSTDANSNKVYSLKFDYTVNNDKDKTDTADDQIDLMYAITSHDYLAPSDMHKYDPDTDTFSDDSYVTTGVGDTNEDVTVNLHFKHALTQIAFTATKDPDIDVYVKSITICNVYNKGTFTATAATDDADDADDADDSINNDKETVGDSALTGDQVNSYNFGTWSTSYDINGWGSQMFDSTDSGNSEGYKIVKVYFTSYHTNNANGHPDLDNYEATLLADSFVKSLADEDSIKVLDSTTSTPLTSTDDVLMLKPQVLTPWEPTTSTDESGCVGFEYNESYKNYYGSLPEGVTVGEFTTIASDGNHISSNEENSLSYLAIDCEIYHSGATDSEAKIHDGYLYVPFETKSINYDTAAVDYDDPATDETDSTVGTRNEWLAGYKITYCLNFGGGYVVDEDDSTTIPVPGTVPDTTTATLRPITYTTTVDDFVDGATTTQIHL